MERPRMRVSGPTVDAANPVALAEFYERLLGWSIVRREGPRAGFPPTDGWVMLRSPTGDMKIEVQWEPYYRRPVWPSADGEQLMMIHLDIGVESLEAGVQWALTQGAVLADHQPQDGVSVMLDPEGHPFCLFPDEVGPPAARKVDELLLDEMTITLRDAQLEVASWVYAWIANGNPPQVVYVGATGLPPTVRTWLHINDDNPDIGRVRAQHPELLIDDVTVRAFEIHADLDRQEVKAWVLNYLAEPHEPSASTSGEQVCAQRIVGDLGDPLRRRH